MPGDKSKTRRKVIIDCDAGTDDAQAIIMALSTPDVDVVAVTAVFGNASLDCTAVNSLRILKLCGRVDIPVYRGCAASLLCTPYTSDGYHGDDGLGDVPHLCPADASLIKKEHAVSAIVQFVNQYQGEMSIVALGPLTNIAMAIHMDPDIGQKLKQIVIMGGNITGQGNITCTAEFNFYSDPEAAHVVLKRLHDKILWIPLELCVENTFSWEWYADFCKLKAPKVQFIIETEKKMIKNAREKEGLKRYPAWDQLAMAVFIDPCVVLESQHLYVDVDLHGILTRGQCLLDRKGTLQQQQPNVTLVTKVDQELYGRLLVDAHRDGQG